MVAAGDEGELLGEVKENEVGIKEDREDSIGIVPF